MKLCLDCARLETPCHIKELLDHVGFFDENNVCKFFLDNHNSTQRKNGDNK